MDSLIHNLINNFKIIQPTYRMWVAWTKMMIVETRINEWLHDIFNTGNDIFADGLYEGL